MGKAANGLNTGNKLGYSGPCPPNGTHRYFFRLYALDTVLPLLDTPRYHDLLDAMQSHILGQAVLIGRYGK
ncbi:MAG: YbhB/YbcL family Raf kinase inhibitor-like protein [Gammaproteobacteria bacterium]|nr:YbhB/YbcL family Raf kinase inhibitor-like protein [Gammaproteobacteria bacterium]